MSSTDQLADILDRLNAGENPDKVKEEARQLLATVDPADLSLAEQKLIEAGLAPQDLRDLCSLHMEVLGDQLEEFRAQLEPGHVVHTLVCEHDHILTFLAELERINAEIQEQDEYDPDSELYQVLHHIGEHLVGAEPHHQREEDVLFPELEDRGVFGPPQIMRLEHEAIRPLKHAVLELAESVDTLEFGEFKRKLDAVVDRLVPTLTDHIWKENNILYPTAVQLVQDEEIWDQLKDDCDEIGYCCFSPEE